MTGHGLQLAVMTSPLSGSLPTSRQVHRIGAFDADRRGKGKRGELEFAVLLRENGFPSARRGCQFKGGPDSPDIACVEPPQVHFEVKRTEKGNPYGWLQQAREDCPDSARTPVVAHRRNGHDWIAILDMRAFLDLLRAHLAGRR